MSAPAISSSGPHSDLEALLARMRQRLYPETIPVLVSYWLKTVYTGGHKRAWWKEQAALLKKVLREEPFAAPAREALREAQAWIQQAGLVSRKAPVVLPRRSEPFRANLRPERLAPYLSRLLNQWLSAEVANLLVIEKEPGIPETGGVPALAVGRAIERLLVRERLSPGTLEMLLDPELLSPQYIYPADAEMLRDVILALLGRTWSDAVPVMPATLLGVAAGSPLPPDYRESVRNAAYFAQYGREEVHVPIPAGQGLEILRSGPVRIASIIVTMDGRWWESDTLQSGEPYSVVYKARGRLAIDYSHDHVRLDVPWPDTQLQWPGGFEFETPFEIFGREWRVSSWETDGERTWLHLVFSRALAVPEIPTAAEPEPARSRSAAVDMAWAAFEGALAASVLEKNREPVEQLRRTEFIPLGRAIFEMAESVKNRRRPGREALEMQLRAIRFLQAEVSLTYGRVPWRILPTPVRAAFLKWHPDPALLELLNEVFDALPEILTGVKDEASGAGHSATPSQAA
jgi:hypothetical protein